MPRLAHLFLLAVLVAPAYAQFVSFGVKGGVQLTDSYSTGSNASIAAGVNLLTTTSSASGTTYDRRYIVGPTAEVHLPLHFSFEVDALYRRNGFTTQLKDSNGRFYITRVRANDWQVPLLAKWSPGSRVLRPFIDAGIVYRHVGGGGISQGFDQNGFFGAHNTAIYGNANTVGEAVGAGLTFKAAVVRLSPEIRYTYWDQRSINTGALASSNKNQVDFLLGITF